VGLHGQSKGEPFTVIGGVAIPSLLFTTSASIDLVDIGGTSTTANTVWQKFDNFTVARTVAPSGTAKGISVVYSTETQIDSISSLDSVYDFYYQDSRNSTTVNTEAFFCTNASVTYPGTHYGYYFNTSSSGTGGTGLFSTVLDNDFVTNNCSGGTNYGGYLTGSLIADLMIHKFQTANLNIGFYIQDTSSSNGHASFDIHCVECIIDGSGTYGYQIVNLNPAQTPAVEISGGEVAGGAGGIYDVFLDNSYGVQVHGVQFADYSNHLTSMVYVNGGGSHIINDNYCFNAQQTQSCYKLNATTLNSVSGNIAMQPFPAGTAQTNFIVAGSTYNSMLNNVCQGYGSICMSFDATSTNNNSFGLSVDTRITTPVSDSGSSNLTSVNGSFPLTLSNIGAGTATSGTYDFSAATQIKLPVAASYASAANGEVGYDTTNKNWHLYQNGTDKILAPLASGFVSGHCGQPTSTSGMWELQDAGGACGVSGGGAAFSSITTGTNTSATMTVGSGGSMTTSGTGTIAATSVGGITVTGTPSANQVLTATSSSAADWQSVGGSAETHTASGSSSLAFTTCITGSNRDYEIRLSDITVNTAGASIQLQFSSDGGSTYDTASNYQQNGLYIELDGSATAGLGSSTNASFGAIPLGIPTTTSGNNGSAQYTLFNPASSTTYKRMLGLVNQRQNSDSHDYQINMGLKYLNTAAVNAFKVFPSSGTFTGQVTCSAKSQ
jgi:hypothetical protein